MRNNRINVTLRERTEGANGAAFTLSAGADYAVTYGYPTSQQQAIAQQGGQVIEYALYLPYGVSVNPKSTYINVSGQDYKVLTVQEAPEGYVVTVGYER